MTTTNLPNTFIFIAVDCPVYMAKVPPVRGPKTIPQIEFEILMDNPYEYTSDNVLYAANGERRGVAREDFFAPFKLDRTVTVFRGGDVNTEDAPLLVGQVTRVAFAAHICRNTLL